MRRGFSLLETIAAMVLLITISAAVVAVYVNVRDRGYEQLGRARLETVLQAQYARAASGGGFTNDLADLDGLAPDAQMTAGASLDPETVSVALGEDGSLGLAVALPNDGCLLAGVSLSPTGPVTAYPEYPEGAACHGALGLSDEVAAVIP